MLCAIAAWVGPIVLINTGSNFYYLLAGLFFSLLFVCLFIVLLGIENLLQRLLIKTNLVFISGFIIGASPFLYLLARGDIQLDTFFQPYAGNALLNTSMIFLLIILLLAYNLLKNRNLWKALHETSLFFLLPVAFIFFGVHFIDTSEAEVIFGNVGLVYFLLINLIVRHGHVVRN